MGHQDLCYDDTKLSSIVRKSTKSNSWHDDGPCEVAGSWTWVDHPKKYDQMKAFDWGGGKHIYVSGSDQLQAAWDQDTYVPPLHVTQIRSQTGVIQVRCSYP